MRHLLVALWILFCSATSAMAQVSVSINVSLFPELIRVPGYPVYYAPRLGVNFFFYDGLYWVFEGDTWYASSWYNGPWRIVYPQYVPFFVLRIPVRYYVSPPPYFRDWRPDRPPRWGQHWGRDWERQRSGWDRWDRKAAPAPAPLPTYQRKYSGERYPDIERQRSLHSENYRYRPREAGVRKQLQEPAAPRERAPMPRGERRPMNDDYSRMPHSGQRHPSSSADPMPRHEGGELRGRPAPEYRQESGRPPGMVPESRRGQGQDKGHDKGQGGGQGRGQERGEHNR